MPGHGCDQPTRSLTAETYRGKVDVERVRLVGLLQIDYVNVLIPGH